VVQDRDKAIETYGDVCLNILTLFLGLEDKKNLIKTKKQARTV